MHRPSLGRLCQHARRRRVEQLRELGFGFGLVDRRMGGRIDDDVRTHGAHGLHQPGNIAKVATQLGGCGTQRNQFAQGCQAALQFPADLAVLAEQQYLHWASARSA